MHAPPERIITLNWGLGRDSTALLLLCLEGRLRVEGLGRVLPEDLDVAVFSDTGCEWAHTYSLLETARQLCSEHGIRFLVLQKGYEGVTHPQPVSWRAIEKKAQAGGYHVRPALIDDYQSRATVASLGKGDCTDNHKIQPIRRLINDLSVLRFGLNNREYSVKVRRGERLPHVSLIGIAADETARLAHGGRGPAYVTEAYPLVTLGIAKPDETKILEPYGLNHVRKSGCFCCPYQPASWYWALSVVAPATWERVVSYERTALARNPRMGITGAKRRDGTPMPIAEVVARWRAINPEAQVDAVLDKQYTRCTTEARAEARQTLAALGAAPPPPAELTPTEADLLVDWAGTWISWAAAPEDRSPPELPAWGAHHADLSALCWAAVEAVLAADGGSPSEIAAVKAFWEELAGEA